MDYNLTISEIIKISKEISITKGTEDGRLNSAISENDFLLKLKEKLNEKFPEWNVEIKKIRAVCDIEINGIMINLKLTNCKTADNSINKSAVFYSITGDINYPYSSNWNDFLKKLQISKENNSIKKNRDRLTEYHYLVKNKLNGDVILKSIFDIHTYISNPSNNLQINWKNEFLNSEYETSDKDYLKKVKSLIFCIQKSVKDMIMKTEKFANEDFSLFFN